MIRRMFEVLRDGKWCECDFKDLKSGDLFHSFEQEDKIIYVGKPVVFEISSNAKQKNGAWVVEIKEPTKALIKENIYGEL